MELHRRSTCLSLFATFFDTCKLITIAAGVAAFPSTGIAVAVADSDRADKVVVIVDPQWDKVADRAVVVVDLQWDKAVDRVAAVDPQWNRVVDRAGTA